MRYWASIGPRRIRAGRDGNRMTPLQMLSGRSSPAAGPCSPEWPACRRRGTRPRDAGPGARAGRDELAPGDALAGAGERRAQGGLVLLAAERLAPVAVGAEHD